ncbi:MAG: hypothetical protein IJ315_07400, partial [Firmicutes bacterium]|nr:hypothetical protein [Bacillota bacterium]
MKNNNGEGRHILPFFWMKGESQEIILEELAKVRECGIKEVCLESRPHPDFAGPKWWEDLKCVIDDCKTHDMRVWILDDSHFPTGYANGGFAKCPEKAKWYLAERHMDVVGPAESSAVWLQPFLGSEGHLLAVLAFQKPDGESQAVRRYGAVDLTEKMHNGRLYWDIPKGRWRIFVLYTTQKGGGRDGYMNLIDSESVRVLIDEVYEKHYEHFGAEFGRTIAGFFSDEPELGNVPGYGFNERLGKADVKLPWSAQLAERLQGRWGKDYLYQLVGLWYDQGLKTGRIRTEYMDELTRLVAECFSGQVGQWCQDHGVEYIGHIIEDDNAHARLGCSIGHYFREQSGQHMAGVDVVHFQIMPGFEDPVHRWIAGEGDGEFFHYALAKLASSYAHVDPCKKGRALCELFGNYSWGYSVSDMKWLTDHMLVRGINYFVPHAFSMTFPDRDCPPHFYARGNNPQFEAFAELMKYTEKRAGLLSRGVHQADAAILYHAEAEWSGGEMMLFQKPARVLMEYQLDYDVISADWLMKAEVTEKNTLRVGAAEYPALILPYCQSMDWKLMEKIGQIAEHVKVIMMDLLPDEVPDCFRNHVKTVFLEELPEEFECKIRVEGYWPHLRLARWKTDGGIICMFFNEGAADTVDSIVHLSEEQRRLQLAPGQSVIWEVPGL